MGLFYCAGYPPLEMLKLLNSINFFEVLSFTLPKMGFLSLKKAEGFLRKLLKVHSFKDLKRGLFICALDIKRGRTYYFNEGDPVKLVLGSCALPGVFEPVKYKEYLLVDGGVTNNLPVEPFLGDELPVVGVDVNNSPFEERPKNLFQLLIRSFVLAGRESTNLRKRYCKLVLEPPVYNFPLFDLKSANKIYKIGYESAKRLLKTKGATL